jgi:excisionase family DNA binding protein
MNDQRPAVTIAKACELVSVSRRTMYNWIQSGKVEYRRTAGGMIRIVADTLWRDPEPPHDPLAPRRSQAPTG